MRRTLFSIVLLFSALACVAEEVTYRIVEFNKSTGDFTLSASGLQPRGAYAWFENEYGATAGNRYNQIPRHREASLWLEGWQGCTIQRITLAMCSNNKAGQFGLCVASGDTQLANYPCRDFADAQWFGQWVSKDLNVYVDLQKDMQLLAPADSTIQICVKGGTSEGSVYLRSITIEYEPAEGMQCVSPLGYVYEKIGAKDALNEGDVVMLYRSGCAATDIDGMEKSGYLDAMSIASTSNVYEYGVEEFLLERDASGKYWTLTDQWDRQLGATGATKLGWDTGVTTWSIQPGYDGVTIASSNTNYGTMRFNAPADSYARFALYTSKSLPLPYLYRQVRQNAPTICSELMLSVSERTVDLAEQDTLVVTHRISPVSATDQRVCWTSSDEGVASVNGGVVTLHQTGDVILRATTADGGAQGQVLLHVTNSMGIRELLSPTNEDNATYDVSGIRSTRGSGLLVSKGKKIAISHNRNEY